MLPPNTAIVSFSWARNLIIQLSSLDGTDSPKRTASGLDGWSEVGGVCIVLDRHFASTNPTKDLPPQALGSVATSLDNSSGNNEIGSRPRTEPRVGATTLSVAITIKSQHSISLECWEIAMNLLNDVPRWSPGVIDSLRTSSATNVSPNWFSSQNTKVIL